VAEDSAAGEAQVDAGSRSRDSKAAAGWECSEGSAYTKQARRHSHRFSWLSPRPLWRSRNDRVARALGDPTDERRKAWMAELDPAGDGRLLVDRARPDGSACFLIVGDTGEGDESQFAVVPPLLSQAEGTDFMFICSDVIYPAGGVEEYEDKFFWPYREYRGDVYAVPGNHDWYDDCTAFMHWFCAAQDVPPHVSPGLSPKGWLRRLLWRRPPHPSAKRLAKMKTFAMPGQPGPYFAIDTGPLLLVGIDTGIVGGIDAQQGAWLKRISGKCDKPKILLTGKPLYVDGEHHAGAIEGTAETVDDIVTAAENNYIAVIGGDIHNYQRYPVKLKDGRTMLYLVSGGGGAFMHETHAIPNIDTTAIKDRVSENEFRCYPLRGDSLSLYSKLYERKLGFIGRLFGAREISPEEAAAFLRGSLGIAPQRPAEVTLSESSRRAAETLMQLPGRGRGALHIPFSEWLDWNQAPLFKNFLRIDATAQEVKIRCFGATGCAAQDDDPPLEDELIWRSDEPGSWRLPD
jgi:Calcineurin-like phosphoesterase